MASNNLPTYSISSNGEPIGLSIAVQSIKIHSEINKIATADVVIKDSTTYSNAFEVTEADTFAPGAKIAISMGYHGENLPIFKGVVLKQSLSVSSSGATLSLSCKDGWIKSTIENKDRAFGDEEAEEADWITTGAIVQEIAGDYEADELECTVGETSNTHQIYVQSQKKDWDTIVNLLEREGKVVVTHVSNLIAAAPNISGDTVADIQFGRDVWSFSTAVDATNQLSKVEGSVWDSTQQALRKVTSVEPTITGQGTDSGPAMATAMGSPVESISTPVPMPEEELQALVDATLLKNRLSSFTGSLTVSGNDDLKPNTQVKLSGFSSRFNGVAFINSVTHDLKPGEWRTELNFGIDTKWFSEKANTMPTSAKSTISHAQGIQIAIVNKVVGDPINNFRVEIKNPFLDPDNQLIWARMSTPYAGNVKDEGSEFGMLFPPEIGTEIIYALINNDPNNAVILGSLHSVINRAPFTTAEDVFLKTLRTSSKMEISFDDSEGKTIMSLLTPAGNSIVMSEEEGAVDITITDKNKNVIKMAEKEMSVESQSKLVISATDEIEIKSKKITITGSDEISASGGKIGVSSDGKLDLTAGGAGTLSSSGAMSVKGSAVNLN
jgi:phage protein D